MYIKALLVVKYTQQNQTGIERKKTVKVSYVLSSIQK